MAQEAINLNLEPRKTLGKSVKHLRTGGITPAVIHDHGKPSLHVQGDSLTLLKVWRQAGKHHPVQIVSDGTNYTALIKEASFDPKKHQLTHLVFNAVDRNQKVEADIPLRPHYDEGNESSPAERSGLIVLTQLENVEVKAISTNLPDFLEYNAEKLVEVGDHLTVADIIVPDGVEIMTEPEHAIATVYEPSAIAAANDAAGGDAEAGSESQVESQSGTAQGESEGQAPENKPGGKDQKEPKPSSVEAAKQDK
ncbi:MAG TPA: 50S ribosomal protein L25 [Candidatus Saccharimonadales bacterium]|nr:50S ribosomal protein L25 [Candidatus Saccharimonadales bacterium]